MMFNSLDLLAVALAFFLIGIAVTQLYRWKTDDEEVELCDCDEVFEEMNEVIQSVGYGVDQTSPYEVIEEIRELIPEQYKEEVSN